MKKSVFCISRDPIQADRMVESLLNLGYSNNDISIMYPESKNPTWPSTDRMGETQTRTMGHEKHSKAPEGATTGALTGGLVGGALGLLAGIGSLSIPGLGPFIAAGPIMATLGGMSLGGGVGMLSGALIGMGIPEYEAKAYHQKLQEGNTLVSVHVDNADQVSKVKEIFKTFGGEDIGVSRESEAM